MAGFSSSIREVAAHLSGKKCKKIKKKNQTGAGPSKPQKRFSQISIAKPDKKKLKKLKIKR